jgi:hypothetical protein
MGYTYNMELAFTAGKRPTMEEGQKFQDDVKVILASKKPSSPDSLYKIHQDGIFENIVDTYRFLVDDDAKRELLEEVTQKTFEELKEKYFSNFVPRQEQPTLEMVAEEAPEEQAKSA